MCDDTQASPWKPHLPTPPRPPLVCSPRVLRSFTFVVSRVPWLRLVASLSCFAPVICVLCSGLPSPLSPLGAGRESGCT